MGVRVRVKVTDHRGQIVVVDQEDVDNTSSAALFDAAFDEGNEALGLLVDALKAAMERGETSVAYSIALSLEIAAERSD